MRPASSGALKKRLEEERGPSSGSVMSGSVALAKEELRPAALDRATRLLYLITLALLPWAWFPPFPWLHEHAQWSDAVFAVAATLWGIELWVNKRLPRLDASHAAMALYVLLAALSLLFATPDKRAGAIKLIGISELVILALMTSDVVAQPERG